MFPLHRIRRLGLPDIASVLPAPTPWGVCDGGDLYLCALGFEPRCLSVSDRLVKDGAKFSRCIYLEYNTNREENHKTLEPLLKNLVQLANSIEAVNADSEDFLARLSGILLRARAEKGAGRAPTVFLDISGFANRFVISSMRSILDAHCNLNIVYAEAEIYHPTEREYSGDAERWSDDNQLGLERGVADVRVSRAFPGMHLDQLPDCIVLFPSFRSTRSLNVIAGVDPAYILGANRNIIWMVGAPRLPEDAWRKDVMRELNKIDESVTSYSISTFDYRETIRALERVYEESAGQCNFTISPLGSKMQAVGIALFCAYRGDVRVMESVPQEYNAASYSEGCKALWCINFGDTDALCAALSTVGTLVMERVDMPAKEERLT